MQHWSELYTHLINCTDKGPDMYKCKGCNEEAGQPERVLHKPECKYVGVVISKPGTPESIKLPNGSLLQLTPSDFHSVEKVERIIQKASIFCMGCAKKEKWVWPPKSSIVGQAAVHSSGLICIPNTIRMLLKETS